jgi:thioredoxin-related protein
MRRIGFVGLFLLVAATSYGRNASSFGKQSFTIHTRTHSVSDSVIEWLDLETAAERNKDDKKLIFIDIYTDWCGWCKKMDQSTFQDSSVVSYMSEHFYSVKMNAESKDPIAYKEILYEYKTFNGKGYNELAVNLLGGEMSFPSFVVLSKKEAKLGTIIGFQKPTELLLALKAYVEK